MILVRKILFLFVLDRIEAQNLLSQVFAIEPSNQTAVLGTKVVLACRVVNKVGTIQWTRDGFGLGIEKNLNAFPRYTMVGNELEGDYSLEINPVNLEDDASFQCQVTAGSNGVSGIRSRSAFLTIMVAPEPPVIVQAKALGDILHTTAGTIIELTCEAQAGKPGAELSWHYSDGAAVVSKNITQTSSLLSDGKRVNSESKLSFVANKEYDNRTVVCRSENSALREPLNASIRLDVKYAPEVTLKVLEPVGQIRIGDGVVILCEANANPMNHLLHKWFKNDEIIIGDYETKLTLTSVDRLMNSAIIACEVSNSVGQSRAKHTLDVSYGPVLKSAPDQVYEVDIGKDVRLKCEVEGNPKPIINWLKLGRNDTLNTDSELLVKAVNKANAGKYICRASVKGFPEIQTLQIVAINGPPHIYNPYSHYGIRGETVRISCFYESHPKPSQVSWYHNRQALIVDPLRGVDIIEDRIPGESTLRSTLIIHNSQITDFGEYNCFVKNQHGNDTMIINLEEKMSFAFLVTIVSILLSMLSLIVLITIVWILLLKKKEIRRQHKAFKKSELSLSSTQSTDSGRESTNSDVSVAGSDSQRLSEVEMRSIALEEAVPLQRQHNFYSNELLFDFNQSFRQYL